MTNQEAIEKLNKIYEECSRYEQTFEKCNCCWDAVQMAINALEKQIQKKPKIRHLKKYDGYNDGECPNCEAYIVDDEFSDEENFCQSCGQAINWSE